MKSFLKFYGKISVGAKGQIVIPVEARKAMNIKSGDKLIIISGNTNNKRTISVLPEEEFNKYLNFAEGHIL